MSTTAAVAEAELGRHFAELYATFRPGVEGYIAKRLPRRDSQLAEDLTAEVFASLWRGRYAQGRPIDGPPWALLAMVSDRRIADHFRRARNAREVVADTTDWSFANSNLTPSASGACQIVNTGFRTARIGAAS